MERNPCCPREGKSSPVLCFTLCYLAYCLIYVSRMNLSMASPALMTEYGFSASQLGVLGSVFFCTYAVGRLLNGNLSDRIAPYVLLSGGLILTGLSNIFSGNLLSFLPMIGLWGLNAYGQSVLWGSNLQVIASVYSPAEATRKASYFATSVAAGNVAGIALNVWLIDGFGVRYAFIVPGVLNIVMAILIARHTQSVPFQKIVRNSFFREIFSLMCDGRVRRMFFPAVTMGMMKDSITFWFAVFFTREYGLELDGSVLLMLAVPLIGFVGRCIYHRIFLLCGQDEHKVSRISFVACLLFSGLLLWRGVPVVIAAVAISMIYFAVSMMNTSFLTIYPLRFSGEGCSGGVSGLMDFMNYMGAGLASLAYGILIEHFGFGAMFLSWCVFSIVSWFLLRRQTNQSSVPSLRA